MKDYFRIIQVKRGRLYEISDEKEIIFNEELGRFNIYDDQKIKGTYMRYGYIVIKNSYHEFLNGPFLVSEYYVMTVQRIDFIMFDARKYPTLSDEMIIYHMMSARYSEHIYQFKTIMIRIR